MKIPCNLQNLCRFHYRMINSSTSTCSIMKNESESAYRKYKSFCTPKIDKETSEKINSVVGIKIGLSYVSWAKIETKGNFLSNLNFTALPDEVNKMGLDEIYNTAHKLVTTLPAADCYVMESLPRIVAGGTGGKTQLMLQATRMQFISMIVAMLNVNRNDEYLGVIFMKPRTTAKLFKLLVGSETASSEEIVTKLLTNEHIEPFSFVNSSPEIISYFTQAERVDKEMLGQAFLLTKSFTELILYKNDYCYSLLFSHKKS